MSEIKPLPAPFILADTIGTDNENKNKNEKITDILVQVASMVMESVKEITESDSVCTCEARVICTNATEDSKPHHMKTEDGLVHMGNIEELNRTNIEPCENFEGCTKSPDGKCMIAQKYKEWIADQEWKAVDETSSQGDGKEKLDKETSYMVCVEYGGIIYFHDDGQALKDFLDNENDDYFSVWALTNRMNKVNYLKQYIELAKIEQLRSGVPWQLTLSQMALESAWGDKNPTDIYTEEYSYNLFGIKNFKPTREEEFVRSWTTEKTTRSELEKWENEQKKWAMNGEELEIAEENGEEIKIKVIQPFRRFKSYEEGIRYHSELLLDEKYSEAWEHEDNPFIYLSIIAPIYATAGEYEDIAGKIMDDYFEWEGKEKDWEDYEEWKENH